MDKALVKKAKKIVKDQYGEAFANKASDAYCIYVSGVNSMQTSWSIGPESISTLTLPSTQAGTIIEFAQTPVKETLGQLKEASAGKNISELLETYKEEAALRTTLQQVWRQTSIAVYRENAIKSMQPINAFLERKIEREFAHGTKSLQQQPYLTRVCWLNQTVQTIAGLGSLAEMAADPQIVRLDVPRKLSAEISKTGKLVFAPQYRNKFSQTGKGIIVAVIDSEIAINHKAFHGRALHRSNYTKEPWGNPDAHATSVAGIITSEDSAYTGMAPGVTIYNYKVLATDSALNSVDFDAALAIQRALEDGVHIANCSWGAGPVTDGNGREARACDAAWELGLTIVKSAGNKGPGQNTLTTPADAEGIIVVGATGKDGKKVESYSSRGPLHSGEGRPHMVAPGGSPADGIFSCLTGGGFENTGYGTSYAAPHVTGLLALILEKHPTLSPDEQRNFLLNLCTKLDGFEANDQGKGIVSMASLL